jgi:hypothetical protein
MASLFDAQDNTKPVALQFTNYTAASGPLCYHDNSVFVTKRMASRLTRE